MTHQDEHVRQALYAQSDGTVAHIGIACLRNGIVVAVDDAVEVLRDLVGDLEQLLVVERSVVDVLRQSEGGEVAHRYFVWRRVLDDLRAEVGRTDGAEVLLVGLAVRSVLVQHVRRAGLDLRFEDFEPQVLRLDGLAAFAFGFVFRVELFERCAVVVSQPWAFVWAHQGPITVLFHTLHEQVRNPKGVEQIACALLFLTVVLLEIEKVVDVGVPGLDVNGKRTLALSASLINVTGGVVEHAQHRNNAVGRAVGSFDVRARGADVVNGKANAPCVL